MSATHPVLSVYRRARCELCDSLRIELDAALADRATAGLPVPVVREIEVADDPDLEARYGGLVPVLSLAGAELPLAMSGRQVRAFLDRVLAADA